MPDQSGETASTTEEEPKPTKRRGPRKEAEIRAEVEKELREKFDAEIQVERDKIRAEMEEAQRAAEADDAEFSDGDPKAEGAHTVHFVDDGLTLFGKVWIRGQELTINPGTEEWDIAHKLLTMDEYAQEKRWGKHLFRPGPWPGKRWDEIDASDFESREAALNEQERERLKKAQEERDSRYGAGTR